jgi:hypothetical protein
MLERATGPDAMASLWEIFPTQVLGLGSELQQRFDIGTALHARVRQAISSSGCWDHGVIALERLGLEFGDEFGDT